MIVEYLRNMIDPDRQDAFIDANNAARKPLMASPYAKAFDLSRFHEGPGSFVLSIEWTSAEDYLRRFRGSEEFNAFLAHVSPFIGDIEEMRHYDRVI